MYNIRPEDYVIETSFYRNNDPIHELSSVSLILTSPLKDIKLETRYPIISFPSEIIKEFYQYDLGPKSELSRAISTFLRVECHTTNIAMCDIIVLKMSPAKSDVVLLGIILSIEAAILLLLGKNIFDTSRYFPRLKVLESRNEKWRLCNISANKINTITDKLIVEKIQEYRLMYTR
jgi:hypothetical protein